MARTDAVEQAQAAAVRDSRRDESDESRPKRGKRKGKSKVRPA